jgi:hypothetical protein
MLNNRPFILGLMVMVGAACSASVDKSGRKRSLISSTGEVVPQQLLWFEDDEEGDSDEVSLAGQTEEAPPPATLSLVPDAQSSDLEAESHVEKVVGDIAVELASRTDDANSDAVDLTDEEAPVETASEQEQSPVQPEAAELIPPYTADLLGACKKAFGLPPDANLPVISVAPGSFQTGKFSVTQDLAFIVFQSGKSIRKLNLKLDNPKGRYCVDMRAEKLLRNVSVESVCGANTVFLKVKAHRSIKNQFIGCESSGSVNTVEVGDDLTGPSQQQVADSCKAALNAASDKQVKFYNLDFGVTRGVRLDVPDRFAVINVSNAKKVVNFKLNLDHPDGRYCVNIQAEKQVKGLTILARCANPAKQTAPQIVGLTLGGKRVKKVKVDTCTPESMQQVEKKVADSKKAISETKDKIKDIRKDKSLTGKEKRAKIAAEKQSLKDSRQAKKQGKKDLRKLNKI